MNINFPPQLRTKHLTIEKLQYFDLENLATQLFNINGFFETKRGLDSVQKIIEYYSLFLNDSKRFLLIAKLSHEPETIVATSSYFDWSNPLYKVEIGFTWIAPLWQKTFVNTELKLGMLSYAFEELNLKRVQFSVQPENINSINAVKRLGATFEGILRNWRYNSIQDTGHRAIFSILDSEWELVKSHLSKKIN